METPKKDTTIKSSVLIRISVDRMIIKLIGPIEITKRVGDTEGISNHLEQSFLIMSATYLQHSNQ